MTTKGRLVFLRCTSRDDPFSSSYGSIHNREDQSMNLVPKNTRKDDSWIRQSQKGGGSSRAPTTQPPVPFPKKDRRKSLESPPVPPPAAQSPPASDESHPQAPQPLTGKPQWNFPNVTEISAARSSTGGSGRSSFPTTPVNPPTPSDQPPPPVPRPTVLPPKYRDATPEKSNAPVVSSPLATSTSSSVSPPPEKVSAVEVVAKPPTPRAVSPTPSTPTPVIPPLAATPVAPPVVMVPISVSPRPLPVAPMVAPSVPPPQPASPVVPPQPASGSQLVQQTETMTLTFVPQTESRVRDLEQIINRLMQSQTELEKSNAMIFKSLEAQKEQQQQQQQQQKDQQKEQPASVQAPSTPSSDLSVVKSLEAKLHTTEADLQKSMSMMTAAMQRAESAEARAVKFEAEMNDFRVAFQKAMNEKVQSAEAKAKEAEKELKELRSSMRGPGNGGVDFSPLLNPTPQPPPVNPPQQPPPTFTVELDTLRKRAENAESRWKQEADRAEQSLTRVSQLEAELREKQQAIDSLNKTNAELQAKLSSAIDAAAKAQAPSASPSASSSSSTADSATIADLQKQLKESNEKVTQYTTKLEMATKGLRQYKSDKERFAKLDEESKRLAELLRKYEAFTGLTQEMIASASVPTTASSTAPKEEKPVPKKTERQVEKVTAAASTPAASTPPVGVAKAKPKPVATPQSSGDKLQSELDDILDSKPKAAKPKETQMPISGQLPVIDAARNKALNQLEAGLQELAGNSAAPSAAPKGGANISILNNVPAGGLNMPKPNHQPNMNRDALAKEHQFQPMKAPEKAAAAVASASRRDGGGARIERPQPKQNAAGVLEDDQSFDPRDRARSPTRAISPTPQRAISPSPIEQRAKSPLKGDRLDQRAKSPQKTAAPFLEPDFEYSNPIEDAAVQRILAVRDRTQLAMAPPTAPPPVDVSTPLRAAMNADPRPDVEKVVSILRSGKEPLDPCWVNRNKVSQLHICAMRNEAALVQKLIAMPGVNINLQDRDGQTALHYAAYHGATEAAEALLRANSSCSAEDFVGSTPLELACEGGHAALVRSMLYYNPNLDHTDRQQRMAIHRAARSGSEEVVQMLLQAGAFADAEDEQCYTPLLLAEKHGHRGVVTLLLNANADPRCCSRSGDTLLWSAIEAGDVARVERLIRETKLDANIQCGRHRWTVLHRAALQLDDLNTAERTVVQLLQLGAKPDIKNGEEKTPLFFAAYRGSVPMCKALLISGANPNATDVAQNTPLHFVRSAEAASLLIERGAKPTAKNKYGNTPLHSAAMIAGVNSELFQMMVRRGGDPRAKNKWGHAAQDLSATLYDFRVIFPWGQHEDGVLDCGGLYLQPKR